MLLKDKHTPKTLDEFIINKYTAGNLLKYAKSKENMNFIFSGISGSGKYTLAKAYLSEMYGPDVFKTKKISVKMKTKEIEILQSKYHYEINLNSYFLNDKQTFNTLISELTGNVNISTLSQNVFIIRNIDLLDKDTIDVFKKIIENTFQSAVYIILSKNGSKTRSLNCCCNFIRVAFPSENEIIDFFKAKTLIPIENTENLSIIKETKNLNFIFSKIEMKMIGVKKSKINKNILDEHIDVIIKHILSGKPSNIIKIREEVYSVICKNFNKNYIFTHIIDILIKDQKITTEKKLELVESARKYQHRMVMAYREIIHIEAFIIDVMKILST